MSPRIRAAEMTVAQTVPYTRSESPSGKSLLMVGDSTAYGVGAESPALSTAGRVGEVLGASVENHARSGGKTRELLAQLGKVQRTSYDVIVIQMGANDITHFSSSEQTQVELDQALRRAKELAPTVVLLTCGDIGNAPLWPWPLGHLYTYRAQVFREKFMTTAKEHGVLYVDLFTKPDVFTTDAARYYAPDGLHLSGEGYG
ncbi:MAG: SGNH/GDSL hydrolase family protein, partial [Candidatus Pacebacteria bacterium]|nr:SGNH/GDSL hydrolase family protein [Candidatus Paceibacterota bacterium]